MSRSAAARLSAVELLAEEAVAEELVAEEAVAAEEAEAEAELAEAREAGGTEGLEEELGVAGITAIKCEGTGRKDAKQGGELAVNRHDPQARPPGKPEDGHPAASKQQVPLKRAGVSIAYRTSVL